VRLPAGRFELWGKSGRFVWSATTQPHYWARDALGAIRRALLVGGKPSHRPLLFLLRHGCSCRHGLSRFVLPLAAGHACFGRGCNFGRMRDTDHRVRSRSLHNTARCAEGEGALDHHVQDKFKLRPAIQRAAFVILVFSLHQAYIFTGCLACRGTAEFSVACGRRGSTWCGVEREREGGNGAVRGTVLLRLCTTRREIQRIEICGSRHARDGYLHHACVDGDAGIPNGAYSNFLDNALGLLSPWRLEH